MKSNIYTYMYINFEVHACLYITSIFSSYCASCFTCWLYFYFTQRYSYLYITPATATDTGIIVALSLYIHQCNDLLTLPSLCVQYSLLYHICRSCSTLILKSSTCCNRSISHVKNIVPMICYILLFIHNHHLQNGRFLDDWNTVDFVGFTPCHLFLHLLGNLMSRRTFHPPQASCLLYIPTVP